MYKNPLLTFIVITIAMMTACSTDVEMLENKSELPYTCEVAFPSPIKDVDTIYTSLYRVVKHKIYAMTVDYTTDNVGKGCFTYGKPSFVKNNNDLKSFEVQIGDYIGIGVSCSYKDFVHKYLYDINRGHGADSIRMQQRTFKHGGTKFYDKIGIEVHTIDTLKDKNAYSTFVTSLTEPLYYLRSPMYSIGKDEKKDVVLKSEKRSMKVNLSFLIKKNLKEELFKITKIEADLAGIPNKMELISGHIDYNDTYKVMIPITYGGDTFTKKELTCKGSVEVLSIVAPRNTQMKTGPGILQLRIFLENQQGTQRIIYSKINLYNTIKKNNFISFTEDQAYTVNNVKTANIALSDTPLKLSGTKIEQDLDNVVGIDVWQNIDTEVIIKMDQEYE